MITIKDKINKSLEIIKKAAHDYRKIGVACSFGKDSIVTVHLARRACPDMHVFSIMTMHKPAETFKYLVDMKNLYRKITVYIVGRSVPAILKKKGIKVVLLDPSEYEALDKESMKYTGKHLFKTNPDRCCKILKVEPAKVAVKDLDAWVCGLRNTEGRTRKDYKIIEDKNGLIKVNPILEWTELDIWRYMAINRLPVHPWYAQGYRSLGCAPCTHLVDDSNLERAGRWIDTSKCGGECGIHTQPLKA